MEGHYLVTKGSILEEDLTMINIYVPKIWTPQYRRLTTIKGEIDNDTIIVWVLLPPLTSMDMSRQKVNKEIQALNDSLHQLGLTDIYKAFHQKL